MSNMESNKIIAEFMGISIDRELAYIEDEGSPLEEVMPVNNLNYHTSWDWLMPVVSKCFKTGDDTHQWDNIMDAMFTCDISIVYAQIVEFINEYNKTK